jgi:hypothetical protein
LAFRFSRSGENGLEEVIARDRRRLCRCKHPRRLRSGLLLVHDIWSSLGNDWGGDNGSFDAELQFGFGSSVELLVDGLIAAIQNNIISSRV